MLFLKCTGEVQKKLGLKKEHLATAMPTESVLGNWYVNRFPISRKSAYIFMSESTLLSFILLQGKRPVNLETLPKIFLAGLEQLLEMRGFDAPAIDRAMTPYATGLFARTDNRSDLGSLNDLVAGYQHAIEFEGGLNNCNLTEIIMGMNDMPQRKLDWRASWEVTEECLLQQ